MKEPFGMTREGPLAIHHNLPSNVLTLSRGGRTDQLGLLYVDSAEKTAPGLNPFRDSAWLHSRGWVMGEDLSLEAAEKIGRTKFRKRYPVVGILCDE